MVYETNVYNVAGKQRISYKNNSNWTDVYACFFNDSSEIASAFPGTKITDNVLSGNVYYSEVNSGQYKFVMFNDGTNQSSATFIPSGPDLVYDNSLNGYNWMPVSITDTSGSNKQRVYLSATFNNFSTYIENSAYDVNAYAWKGSGESAIKNAAWPGLAMTRIDSLQKVYYIDLDHEPRIL